jgi:hypothetical protein
VITPIVRLLRLASLAICVVVLASFAIFAYNQSKEASAHQTQEITVGPNVSQPKGPAPRESSLHKTIDEASNDFTSPFAGVVSGSSNEWLVRGVKLLLALAIYGVGFGFLARLVRLGA